MHIKRECTIYKIKKPPKKRGGSLLIIENSKNENLSN